MSMNAVYDGKGHQRGGHRSDDWDDDDDSAHKRSWFGRRSSSVGASYGLQLHRHASKDDPRLRVTPENEHPEEQSSERKIDVAKRYVANRQLGVLITTFFQILFGAAAQSLIIGFAVTVLPNVLSVTTVTPALLVLQGFIVFVAFIAAPRAAVHYSVDCLLLLLRMLLPLLTSDVKMDFWFRRDHRWRDQFVMTMTTPVMFAAALGGWVGGLALIGWLNGSYSDIGNPDPTFVGIGPYDTYQIMGIVGACTTFLYFTFGSYWIVSSNGHVKHIIDVLKDDEMPDDAQVFNYAIFRSIMCVVNIAVTGGSPVIFEQLVSGAIINSSTHNIGYWIAALFAGFFVAFIGLFFDHHIFSHYRRAAKHVKSSSTTFLTT